jgi:hypothetical protein
MAPVRHRRLESRTLAVGRSAVLLDFPFGERVEIGDKVRINALSASWRCSALTIEARSVASSLRLLISAEDAAPPN